MESHWDRLPADLQQIVKEMAYKAMVEDVMKFIPLLKCDDNQAVYREVVKHKREVDAYRRKNRVFEVGMVVKYVSLKGSEFLVRIEKINRKFIDVTYVSRATSQGVIFDVTEDDWRWDNERKSMKTKKLPSQLQIV